MDNTPVPNTKISLNKLWKLSGRSQPFKDFCEQMNAKRFKNMIGSGTNIAYTPVAIAAPAPVSDAPADAIPADTPTVAVMGNRESALYVVFGAALGMVGVLLYKKYSRK